MIWCDRTLVLNPLYVGLCLSKREFTQELKRMGVKNRPSFLKTPNTNATVHLFESDGKECAIVCLGKTKGIDPISVAGLLVHESVHIWQAARKDMGEHMPSSEFEAYSVQMISQSLMSAYMELSQ